MKLTFEVNYRTEWGESLFLSGTPEALGGGDTDKAVAMTLNGHETWQVTVELPDSLDVINYCYFVRHDNGSVKREWGKGHRFERSADTSEITILDRWHDQPWDKPYYASAFTDCICNRADRTPAVEAVRGMLTLCVDAPMIRPDEAVAVSGASAALGAWDPAKAPRMSDAEYPTWRINLPLDAIADSSEYKFLIVKKATGDVVAWEGRDNRWFNIPPSRRRRGSHRCRPASGQPLSPWRGAGVAIPVFSLRSEEDFGVGDFMDLKRWSTGPCALIRISCRCSPSTTPP